MKQRRDAGLTLLEVLISVALLSLLSVGILTAIQLGVSVMGKANAKLMDNRRIAGTQNLLEQQIAGFMPVMADVLPAPDRPLTRMPFFQGEAQSMRFVSTYSLQEAARGHPQILEFQVIPGENHRGVRLIVNEHVYTGPASAGMFCLGYVADPVMGSVPRFRPIEAGTRSFVLADKLAYCKFSYLDARPQLATPQWEDAWVLVQWPYGVRIAMASLEPDPSRLHMVTVTAAVHVDRPFVMERGDY
jgi:prepilin-type N-terminal cleavage/methylation domain-containing protein